MFRINEKDKLKGAIHSIVSQSTEQLRYMRQILNSKPKVFCIGRNKTGTTSLEFVLKEFGYKMGIQAKGERLIDNYILNDWKGIVKFCRTAEAFQDIPFSCPYTWLMLYNAYPNAKYILTVRDEEDWYKSICAFQTKLFSQDKALPTIDDLKNATYRYKGFIWKVNRAVYKTPEDDIYNKEMLISNYKRHNEDVLHFFKEKPNFLCINVSKPDSYLKLANFLNKKPQRTSIPKLNETNEN